LFDLSTFPNPRSSEVYGTSTSVSPAFFFDSNLGLLP